MIVKRPAETATVDGCGAACTNCRHVARSHSMARGLPILIFECNHEKIRGLMRCESCNSWDLFENYKLEPGGKLRCCQDGCRHKQSIPNDNDSRIRYLGHCLTAKAEPYEQQPPHWCPGYLQVRSAEQATTKPPKQKRLTKKQRRDALQPSLFG